MQSKEPIREYFKSVEYAGELSVENIHSHSVRERVRERQREIEREREKEKEREGKSWSLEIYLRDDVPYFLLPHTYTCIFRGYTQHFGLPPYFLISILYIRSPIYKFIPLAVCPSLFKPFQRRQRERERERQKRQSQREKYIF